MTISTHVLDLAAGAPVAGVAVRLVDGGGRDVGAGVTDTEGRLRFEGEFATGDYTLRFDLEGVSDLYAAVSLEARLREDRHYHLPLLVSPYGLSAYRGS